MPVLYLSHGAPPLADDPVWTDELARWTAGLPKPTAVLMVSAHWEEAPTTLSAMAPGADAAPPAWSAEFDAWTDAAVTGGDVDALLDFRAKAPAARVAHPRTEHFAPLFALDADAENGSARRSVIDGYWFGMAKRSFRFG